jgi:predicted DsbA family dithiol-disulfide isomerase
MIIDFFFDTICPWSYVGKRRLERVLVERKNQNISVNWCSLLLNPDLPPPGIDQDSYPTDKFGTENRIHRVYDKIKDVGLSVNIDFNFNTIRHTPNTIDTHRLVHFAGVNGKSETALDLLFKNYFVEGKNIGDVKVLMVIAKSIGLDTQAFSDHLKSPDGIAEIYANNARAQRLGINGMPSYVFNGNLVISGAQEPNVLERMLDAASGAAEAF